MLGLKSSKKSLLQIPPQSDIYKQVLTFGPKDNSRKKKCLKLPDIVEEEVNLVWLTLVFQASQHYKSSISKCETEVNETSYLSLMHLFLGDHDKANQAVQQLMSDRISKKH